MKRRINSDTLIPVRFDSFLREVIWDSDRNIDTRFMPCIYVGHTMMSRRKREVSENKFAGVVRLLLTTLKLPRESATHFRVISCGFSKHLHDHKFQFCVLTRTMPNDGG